MPISDESLNVRNFALLPRLTQFTNMLWHTVLINGRLLARKLSSLISCMKTKILAGLLVAAALAIAPGIALADGGFHVVRFHRGFAHHGFFVRGFRRDHDRFFGRHFAFANPWPWYHHSYADYSAHDYSD
jgi:hypothetical protein